MNAHVLLNLLNELGKRDKMRGLPMSINELFNIGGGGGWGGEGGGLGKPSAANFNT